MKMITKRITSLLVLVMILSCVSAPEEKSLAKEDILGFWKVNSEFSQEDSARGYILITENKYYEFLYNGPVNGEGSDIITFNDRYFAFESTNGAIRMDYSDSEGRLRLDYTGPGWNWYKEFDRSSEEELGPILQLIDLNQNNRAPVLFTNDFETDLKGFENQSEPGTIVEIDKGSLHLKAVSGKGIGVSLEQTFPRNTLVSFKIKLGEKQQEGHPLAHLNLITSPGDTRICVLLDENNMSFFYNAMYENNLAEGGWPVQEVVTGEWLQIDAAVTETLLLVSINGRAAGSFEITDSFKEMVGMSFECHQEYWIDDFTITPFALK